MLHSVSYVAILVRIIPNTNQLLQSMVIVVVVVVLLLQLLLQWPVIDTRKSSKKIASILDFERFFNINLKYKIYLNHLQNNFTISLPTIMNLPLYTLISFVNHTCHIFHTHHLQYRHMITKCSFRVKKVINIRKRLVWFIMRKFNSIRYYYSSLEKTALLANTPPFLIYIAHKACIYMYLFVIANEYKGASVS